MFVKGYKPTKEHVEKMRESLRGRKLSEEHKKKISESRIGKSSPMKGRHHSKETKEKMSLKHMGVNNPAWRCGKSFEPYTIDWNITLKRAIRERDNYICGLCKQYGIFVHHIDYDKKNCNPDNLITLCQKCHCRTNYNRNYWITYFKKCLLF